jgi:hypothetical protein
MRLRSLRGAAATAAVLVAAVGTASSTAAARSDRHGPRPHVYVAYIDNTYGNGTFGKTTVGAFVDHGMFSNFKIVHHATLPASGWVKNLKVYAVPGDNSPSPQVLKAVVYADAGGAPGALVATGKQVFYRGDRDGSGWFTLPFASPVHLDAGTYWLGFITGEVTSGMGYRYDVVANSRAYNANAYQSGPSDPFGPATEDSEEASIYAQMTDPFAFPLPWRNAADITFAGCGYGGVDACPTNIRGDIYDAGAIRVADPWNSGTPMHITGASVQIGPCSYDPWPGLDVTIQPASGLILTETGTAPRCTSSGDAEQTNFDTSESFLTSPQYQQFMQTGECRNDGYVPVIRLTINGATVVVRDRGQILNKGGIDPDVCNDRSEAIGWQQIR